MSHQTNGSIHNKYEGLPGHEDHAKRTFDKQFEEIYGQNLNAESVYVARPHTFARFAKVYPRTAFLVDELRFIYENIDDYLDQFKADYGLASPDNTLSQQPVRF